MEDAQLSVRHRRCILRIIYAQACCLNADETHVLVLNEIIEHTHGVRATADAGHEHIRKASLLLQHLRLDFLTDNLLEVTHDFRIRMRSHNTAQNVICILYAFSPYTQRLVDSILQRACTARNRHNLRAEQLHTEHVERLTLAVLLAHIYDAFHVHERCCRRRSHTVLTSAGFSDNAFFAHPLCQQNLTEHVIDFMSAGVIQILALQINLAAAKILRHLLCIIEHRRSVGIFAIKSC